MHERPMMYYLDETGTPIGVYGPDCFADSNLREWYAHAWEPGPRSKRVAESIVDRFRIFTVFLSIDHEFYGGPPVLWETMIFNGDTSDLYCRRYTSREDAERGHAETVQAVLDGKLPERE